MSLPFCNDLRMELESSQEELVSVNVGLLKFRLITHELCSVTNFHSSLFTQSIFTSLVFVWGPCVATVPAKLSVEFYAFDFMTILVELFSLLTTFARSSEIFSYVTNVSINSLFLCFFRFCHVFIPGLDLFAITWLVTFIFTFKAILVTTLTTNFIWIYILPSFNNYFTLWTRSNACIAINILTFVVTHVLLEEITASNRAIKNAP